MAETRNNGHVFDKLLKKKNDNSSFYIVFKDNCSMLFFIARQCDCYGILLTVWRFDSWSFSFYLTALGKFCLHHEAV